jgi:hypothetical protein
MPLIAVDPDGKVIVWADNIDPEKLEKYKAHISKMRAESVMFNYIYEQLDNAETVFKINVGDVKSGEANFNPNNGTINYRPFHFSMKNIAPVIEEFVHAYQFLNYVGDKDLNAFYTLPGKTKEVNNAVKSGEMTMEEAEPLFVKYNDEFALAKRKLTKIANEGGAGHTNFETEAKLLVWAICENDFSKNRLDYSSVDTEQSHKIGKEYEKIMATEGIIGYRCLTQQEFVGLQKIFLDRAKTSEGGYENGKIVNQYPEVLNKVIEVNENK